MTLECKNSIQNWMGWGPLAKPTYLNVQFQDDVRTSHFQVDKSDDV